MSNDPDRPAGAHLHHAFAQAFNARDLDALGRLLDRDATAEVLGAGFPVERGAHAIVATSLPYLLETGDPLGASVVEGAERPWVLLRTAAGRGPVDMAVHLDGHDDRITLIAYVTAAHQPGPLGALARSLGLSTTADGAP